MGLKRSKYPLKVVFSPLSSFTAAGRPEGERVGEGEKI
jgi:hypothetical protein